MADELLLKAARDLYARRGKEATYSPVDDFQITCRVILDFENELRPDGYDIEIVDVGTTIEALYSDVGEPKKGSTFEIEGTVYRVARIDSNDRVFVKCVVSEVL